MHLSNPREPVTSLTIHDVSGKHILEKDNVNSNALDLDISSLKPGAYFIEIKSQSQNKITKKLIVL